MVHSLEFGKCDFLLLLISCPDEGLGMPLLQDEIFETQIEENSQKVKRYVGGYICKKLKIKATKDNQSEWIALKGKGRLLEPSEEVMDAVNKSDEVFSQYNGQKLSLRQDSDPLGRVQRLILKKNIHY